MAKEMQSPEEINRRLYRFHEVHVALPSPDAIQQSHLDTYWQQGFAAANGFLTEEEIRLSVQELMSFVEDPDTKAKVQFTKARDSFANQEEREFAVRKIHDFVMMSKTLHAVAYKPELLAIVERIAGEPVKLVQDMALLKPPTNGGEKPWHQDMAYGPLAYDKPVIGVWIALDAAELDNGCMHVIPRSHMQGGTPHYAVRDWQICDSNVHVEKDVAVPLQPGGALFFHGLLHHGTPNNMSLKRRRALQFHYAPVSAEKLNPREYKRLFTNEMTNAEC